MTNNTIEGWNSKISSIIGMQQPNVGTQINRSIVGILAAEVKGTWRIWSKRGKAYMKQDDRFKKYGITRYIK
jgi:hypothetical protein